MPEEEIEKNYAEFKKRVDDLLEEHAREFVVFHSERPQEFFVTFEDAWKWAKEKFEPETFIILKVEKETSNYIAG